MKLAVDAELLKLAEELTCDREDLAFLERFGADELEELRHTLYHALDEKFRPAFRRLELAARLLPNALVVRIAKAHFPPMILGRTSTELSVDRAKKLLPLLDSDFIADCAPYMDPERAKPMVGELPMDTMLPVIKEVIRRRDHVSMGRMLGAIHAEHIPVVVGLLHDGRDLLLIGFHCEDRSVLDPIISAMADEQVVAIVQAADEHGLESELQYVLGHLSSENHDRLLAAAGPELRSHLDPDG